MSIKIRRDERSKYQATPRLSSHEKRLTEIFHGRPAEAIRRGGEPVSEALLPLSERCSAARWEISFRLLMSATRGVRCAPVRSLVIMRRF